MLFLASQIWLWIAAGFLFGALIGWWMSGAMMLDLGSTAFTSIKSDSAQKGSISVLSDSLLKTQRELESCQESLAIAEAKLKELGIETARQDKAIPRQASSTSRATIQADSTDELERDDLTLIYGIGPVIERKLAQLDITTYRQIAGLSIEELLQVGDYINYFPGRIERDGWQESARELHRQKYGEEI